MIDRFLDYLAWRWRAFGQAEALEDDARDWDQKALYCMSRAEEQRALAKRIRDAKQNLRFPPPKGIAQ